jgi:carbon storage regulator
MLILSRKPGEEVVIGEDIRITVLAVLGNRVHLGFRAPGRVEILRSELCPWIEAELNPSATETDG